jgi:SHOCT-like protein
MMSSEERKKILDMVAEGKISAEEAAKLMRALEESTDEEPEVIDPAPGYQSEKTDASEFDEVRRRARRFAMVPLWIGVLFTVLTAWGMYAIQQNVGYNFWFYCLTLPMLFGILLIALGAGGQSSRWLYVNVDRARAQDWPRKITLAFPLPLGLVGWFLRSFGNYIGGLGRTNVDEVLSAISMTRDIQEPLIVNVDETDEGERVQIYIG